MLDVPDACIPLWEVDVNEELRQCPGAVMLHVGICARAAQVLTAAEPSLRPHRDRGIPRCR
jgi:hypothetical protein